MSDTPRTDALKHSIERPNTGYRCLRKNERTDDLSDALNLCCQLERKLSAANAEIERLRASSQDAERLNHLESYGNVVAGLAPDLDVLLSKFGWTNQPLFEPPRTLRQAIDVAMTASKDGVK